MSKLGLSLCMKLREEPNLEVLQRARVTEDMLKGTDKKLFIAITKHFREYGKMPEWETVLDEVDFDPETLPKPKEPARYYADAIIKLAAVNSQREWMHKMAEALKEQDPLAFVAASKGVIRDADERFHLGGGEVVDFTRNGAEWLAEYEKFEGVDNGITGIRSPWSILDESTLGWNPGDLVATIGRTGTGKTWDAILNADAAHQQGHAVGFISMEMPVKVIRRRRDAIRFKLPYEDFKRGKLDQEAKERWKQGILGDSPADEARWFAVASDRIQTCEDVELFVEETGIRFLVIDGFYKLQDEKARSDWDRVTRVVRKLQKMTLKRGISTLVTTQTTKMKGDDDKKKKVTIEDTAFADTINQECAIVKTLYQGEQDKSDKVMCHRLGKNREGQLMDFVSEWDFDTMAFAVMEGVSSAEDAADDKPARRGKGKAADEDIPF